MGINGLLPQLRSVTKRSNLRDHAGKRAAVDAYSLLHKGSYSCAMEMVEGLPTDRYVQYCMWRVKEMRDAGVEPILVFDGGRLPNKRHEEASRQSSRSEARAKARALRAAGNHSAALDAYRRGVDVTPWHARRLQDAAEQAGVSFVVAPYEADAQMALLATTGEVDLVITEDSDLLAYGCPAVLFKLDRAGTGDLVLLEDLQDNKALQLRGWDLNLFRQMCVMAGCDFLPNLPGIGVKRAHAAIRRSRCFVQAVRQLRWDGTAVPDDYLEGFQRALWTFGHQRVFCERAGAAVPLTPLPEGGLASTSPVPGAAELFSGDLDFLGPPIEASIARAIARGEIDPMTHEPFRPPANLAAPVPRPVQASWAAPAARPPAGRVGRAASGPPAGAPFRSPATARGALSIRDVFGGSTFARRSGTRVEDQGPAPGVAAGEAPEKPATRSFSAGAAEQGADRTLANAAATPRPGSESEPRDVGAGAEAASQPEARTPSPRPFSSQPEARTPSPRPFSSQPEAHTPPPPFSGQTEARTPALRRPQGRATPGSGQQSLRRALERGAATARARPPGPIVALPFQAPRVAKDVQPKRTSPHFAKASRAALGASGRTASLLTMLSRKRPARLRPIELLDDDEGGGGDGNEAALCKRPAQGAATLEAFRAEPPAGLCKASAPQPTGSAAAGEALAGGLASQAEPGAEPAVRAVLDGEPVSRAGPGCAARDETVPTPEDDGDRQAFNTPPEDLPPRPSLGPVAVCSQGASATNAGSASDEAPSDEESALPGELYAGVAGEEPPLAGGWDGSPLGAAALLPELDLCRTPPEGPDAGERPAADRPLRGGLPRPGRARFAARARASPASAPTAPFAAFIFEQPRAPSHAR